MPIERVQAFHAPWTVHFECSRLDTGSGAMPNDRVYYRYPFGKDSRNVAIGRGQHRELQTKLPRMAQAIC